MKNNPVRLHGNFQAACKCNVGVDRCKIKKRKFF